MAKEVNRKKNRKGMQFDYSEIYRQLRTNIEFSSFEDEGKIINVTSTNPGEGKSSVASNLAIICSDKYEKVLLIDCDLRKPTQHKRFKITNKIGLSNLLKDKHEIINPDDNYYFKRFKNEKNEEGHLYILTCGSKVPNPAELLASKKFGELIDKLREEFDYIIVDCPPISAVTDAIPVSSVCDGTIFVVSSKDTNKIDAKDALKQLQRNGVKIMGSVLTKVEDPTIPSYGYYYGD